MNTEIIKEIDVQSVMTITWAVPTPVSIATHRL